MTAEGGIRRGKVWDFLSFCSVSEFVCVHLCVCKCRWLLDAVAGSAHSSALLCFHLRMLVVPGSSCSAATPGSGLWRRGPWLRLRGWALSPALPCFSLSPCRGGRGCSCSGWEGTWRWWCSTVDPEGEGEREEQRLRLSHKAPQFCSHCRRTLRVSASFTSSPQLSRIFTSSTYGLHRDRWITAVVDNNSLLSHIDMNLVTEQNRIQ